nr:abscisic acid and environmental stress-inducible protein [Drosophila virilis]
MELAGEPSISRDDASCMLISKPYYAILMNSSRSHGLGGFNPAGGGFNTAGGGSSLDNRGDGGFYLGGSGFNTAGSGLQTAGGGSSLDNRGDAGFDFGEDGGFYIGGSGFNLEGSGFSLGGSGFNFEEDGSLNCRGLRFSWIQVGLIDFTSS